MDEIGNRYSASMCNEMKKQDYPKNLQSRNDAVGGDLWTDGLICAFEYVKGQGKTGQPKSGAKVLSAQYSLKEASRRRIYANEPENVNSNNLAKSPPLKDSAVTVKDASNVTRDLNPGEEFPRAYWEPIGWDRVYQLVQMLQADDGWGSQPIELTENEDEVTVTDLAAPYWERPVGPTWWCHVAADHPSINAWLSTAQWLHPAISVALRDESTLISERMKHLFYEVPVIVAGGLLFELLGQSAGDPLAEEDDIPIVLRSWHAQNFLITALHIKGSASNINVLGIAEVQEMLIAGATNIPRTIHEVIAHLTCRLARWDDRLFRKSIFGEADEVELKFMNRRNHEDLHLFTIILNQEIRRLSTQVIRVKWSLHAREEIVFELLQHLRGNAARSLLHGVRKSTREMISEQEAVRGRLFTIQDVMQSTVRAWLQDRSLTVTHNLGIFGGCGLILSIITGLFGINVDGIPGNDDSSPHAFLLFSCILVFLGVVLISSGLLYLGLKKPIIDEDVEVRKLELDELVRMFQKEAESHAQVRKSVARAIKPPTTASILPSGEGYVLIG
ncbi:zinc transport protein ZntB-like isoform X2 [Gossypium australe]|uniref:Zinc transport protein ZntB-like isoform X2 n=1 Tax=Gossypium australe TaxID=47621 RepID=A0A5B6UE84_9ROSI|nr:zinc transport protein ZntB-like isoform X2 [Gossypium australe]